MMLSRRMAALRLAAPSPSVVDAALSVEDVRREASAPPPAASAAPSPPRPVLYESRGNDRRPHRR